MIQAGRGGGNDVEDDMECRTCENADRRGMCLWSDNCGPRPCEEQEDVSDAQFDEFRKMARKAMLNENKGTKVEE